MPDLKVTSKGGLGISMQVKGLKATTQALLKLTPELKKEIDRKLLISALKIATNAKVAATVDAGRMRAAIFPEIDGTGLVGKVRVRTKYAAFVEFGTGPLGASTNTQELPEGYVHGPAYMPPPAALQRWAERHGIRGAGAGFLIARKIKEKGGTEAKPFLGPAFEAEKESLQKGIQESLNVAVAAARSVAP